ncbi:hypothetical protein JZ751_008920 [Albula glossodonta]|uniref:Uncharacterized protein n=1 Tax=Albula glossodonta TaxID=121402 RepID=A0A8T2NZJ7_9TELE|nr:hypothetical protein JZ751_008920 [Albula glossodonta]
MGKKGQHKQGQSGTMFNLLCVEQHLPLSSYSKNTIAVGPLSKALHPTLLPGGIGPWDPYWSGRGPRNSACTKQHMNKQVQLELVDSTNNRVVRHHMPCMLCRSLFCFPLVLQLLQIPPDSPPPLHTPLVFILLSLSLPRMRMPPHASMQADTGILRKSLHLVLACCLPRFHPCHTHSHTYRRTPLCSHTISDPATPNPTVALPRLCCQLPHHRALCQSPGLPLFLLPDPSFAFLTLSIVSHIHLNIYFSLNFVTVWNGTRCSINMQLPSGTVRCSCRPQPWGHTVGRCEKTLNLPAMENGGPTHLFEIQLSLWLVVFGVFTSPKIVRHDAAPFD